MNSCLIYDGKLSSSFIGVNEIVKAFDLVLVGYDLCAMFYSSCHGGSCAREMDDGAFYHGSTLIFTNEVGL